WGHPGWCAMARTLSCGSAANCGDTPMQRITWGILVLMLNLSVMMAEVNGQDKTATPAEQYQALFQEYQTASSSGVPLTDAERLKFVGRAYKQRFALAAKLLDLAEKYPDDPIALEALTQAVWQVNTTPWPVELVGEDTARPRAFELIQRNHIRSDK